jgi:hypothetical protein
LLGVGEQPARFLERQAVRTSVHGLSLAILDAVGMRISEVEEVMGLQGRPVAFLVAECLLEGIHVVDSRYLGVLSR